MRKPISGKQNLFFNGELIDNTNLNLEQNYNNLVQTGLINNHIGTGILPENLTQVVLFDSNLASGFLDGKAIDVQAQTSDVNYGNQLEISLTDSLVAGKRCIKICIIGLDFNSNLQYDRFTFNKNEKQFSKKHYSKILKIFFNDFVGDPDQSLNLGGRITIKEAKPLSLTRDCVMVAQDTQPNIFFRDFFTSTGSSLNLLLTTSLPSYNVDALDIAMGYNQLRNLLVNDVSSQIGQKFQATTNNIQKISLLLSVTNSITPSDLEWTGDLIISIYQLQSAVDCPLDIAPNTAIDFDPSNIPLAQLSTNYSSLLASGILLDETPQPVDFIFSNTPVGSGNIIKTGSYYVVTVKRAGSADKCSIQLATGADRLDNSKITFFNGSIWVDVADEDLWFQVWTDSAQVTDGQAYDGGHGVIIPKTIINSTTGITEDYISDNIQFARNDIFYGIVEATTEQSGLVQDQRTGENVFSEQQFIPTISLISANDLIERESVSDPLIIGSIADKNAKAMSAGTSTIGASFHHFGSIGNKYIVKVIDDPSDGYRYDLSVLNLITELTGSGGVSNINGILNAKISPNDLDTTNVYRISDTEIISMIYGDLNGDGIVDELDLLEIQSVLDSDLNVVPTYQEYLTFTSLFQSDVPLEWELLDDDGVTVIDSGIDGILTANPTDGTKAIFNSTSAAFDIVSSLNTKKIKILNNNSNPGNNGSFKIVGYIDSVNVDIQKMYYTSDTILKILRADINGDMIVDSEDFDLMTDYINKVSPFPATTSPANKIGTEFNAIRFTFEKYIDRSDDYISSSDRSIDLHSIPDILMDGYDAGFSIFGEDVKNSQIDFTITKQFGWKDYLVTSNSNPKLVPASFNYQSGFTINKCSLEGIIDDQYPLNPEFDPGRNDIFLPNNLVINTGGEILRPDGYYAKMDFEVGTIILEIPAISFSSEKYINVFSDLVANYSSDGKTRLGYQAMRFSDCSFVGLDALDKNQVRFNVAVRSFSPQINGEDADGYAGVLVDGRIGITMDPNTGILTLNFTNLYEDTVLQTMKTRVQITAFLKKAGFNNEQLIVGSTKLQNILGL